MMPPELVRHVTDGSLLVRTAVVLLPPQQVPEYQLLAIQWGAEPVDLAQRWLVRIPEGSRYLALSLQSLLTELDDIATSTLRRRCAAVANVDLLLARLPADDRLRFWDYLFLSLKKRPTALLLLMPAGAEHLFSSAEVERWCRAGRLSQLNEERALVR